MAFVYFPCRIGLEDEHGMTGAKEVVVRVDADVQVTPDEQREAALTHLEEFVVAFDDVTDCEIVSVTMTIPLDISGIKGAPGEQGVAQGANLVLSTEDLEAEQHERPYWLPGAKEGVFLSNFRTVDTGDTELLAWIASFNDNATGCAICISDKEQVLSVVRGRYATRQRDSSG